MSDRIATTEAREEGFYWVVLGRNPPEIAYSERGEWWLAGDPKPWHPEAVTVARTIGVQATVGAGRMMIRSNWRYHDDDPPASRPIAITAAVVFGVVWVVVALGLLASLALRFF